MWQNSQPTYRDPGWKKPRSREPSQPALSYEHIEAEVKRDLGNRAHMKRTLKKFDLLLTVLLHVLKGKKIATQGRTRTFRILIVSDFSYPNRSPLPLHYHTAPSKFRKNLSTYTSKLSFLTVTSTTADPSPFHNF